jgi:hypothetical protein
LRLKPHPEGGHYRETFRDSAKRGRAHSTAIYFLLKRGEESRWHRIDAAEIWHFYAGAPLALSIAENGRTVRHISATTWRRNRRRRSSCPPMRGNARVRWAISPCGLHRRTGIRIRVLRDRAGRLQADQDGHAEARSHGDLKFCRDIRGKKY